MNLYAQIAHKLGLYSIKSELEDIALKYLEPEDYAYISRRLEETAAERDEFIAGFVAPIRERLDAQGIQYHIKGRTKSVYSIWRKMKRTGVSFDEVYDIFAIRIIVECPTESEKQLCWSIYSIVTDFYTPNPDRMRDWISIPKSNGYESLHTTVVTKDGHWVEIQIRSVAMDFWASLEHEIKYKKEIENDGQLIQDLKDCADVIAETDRKMLELRERMRRDSQRAFQNTVDEQQEKAPDTPT